MKTAGLWMYTAIPRELYVIVFEIEMLALFFFFFLVWFILVLLFATCFLTYAPCLAIKSYQD